jgi:acyl-CoA thioesterase
MSVPDNLTRKSNTLTELMARAEGEPIASFLKIRTLELSTGYARVSMKILPEHLNFNGLIFGGIISAVADQAFSLGANSVVMPAIASQFNIYYLNAPAIGDELIAECRVLKSGRRVGVSEITVTNQSGKLIAKATGATIPVTDRAPK